MPDRCINDNLELLSIDTTDDYNYGEESIDLEVLRSNIANLDKLKSVNILSRAVEGDVISYYRLLVLFENGFLFWNVTMLKTATAWKMVELEITPYSKLLQEKLYYKDLADRCSKDLENINSTISSLNNDMFKNREDIKIENSKMNENLKLILEELQRD